MRTLTQIADDIREHIRGSFPQIRYSTARTPEQIANEIQALSHSSLPAVVMFLEGIQFRQQNPVRTITVTLMLVDRFYAGSGDRTRSAWDHCETLYGLFPQSGLRLNGVFYLPDCVYTSGETPSDGSSLFFFRLLLQQ